MELATVWPLFCRKFLEITQVSSWNVEPENRNSITFGCRKKKGKRQVHKGEKNSCLFHLQNDTGMKRQDFLHRAAQDFAKVQEEKFGMGELRNRRLWEWKLGGEG